MKAGFHRTPQQGDRMEEGHMEQEIETQVEGAAWERLYWHGGQGVEEHGDAWVARQEC